MDFVKLLGGIALGATGAALFDAMRAKNKLFMGQGVVTGGVGGGLVGGGPAGGGPGVIVGPPPSGGGNFMGPGVVDMPPLEGGDGSGGPIISVPPGIVGPGLPGSSFFGISAAPWFWPLNVNWMFPRPPVQMVCVKTRDDDEEVMVCRESYPVQPVAKAYAWGPPAGWL
jgi:hypothetical protein